MLMGPLYWPDSAQYTCQIIDGNKNECPDSLEMTGLTLQMVRLNGINIIYHEYNPQNFNIPQDISL